MERTEGEGRSRLGWGEGVKQENRHEACRALDDVGSERWSVCHFSRAAAWRQATVSRWKAWSIRRREVAWPGGSVHLSGRRSWVNEGITEAGR